MQSRTSAAAPALARSDRLEAALALRVEGCIEEALAALAGPGEFSQDVYILRGDLQLELGQIQEAIGSYSTVLAFASDHVYALDRLAVCLRRLERWQAAAEVLRKLLARDSHRDGARIALGDCLLRMNLAEEALACFDACWSEATRIQALFGKAVALQLLRRFPESESAYERLLALDAKAEEAFSNLVAMSLEQFNLVRVHRYSLRLLELCPQSRIALQGLALVACERAEYESAARYFHRLARLTRGDPQAEASDGDEVIEYRLSLEALEQLNQVRRDDHEAGGKRPDHALGGD